MKMFFILQSSKLKTREGKGLIQDPTKYTGELGTESSLAYRVQFFVVLFFSMTLGCSCLFKLRVLMNSVPNASSG